MPVFIMKELVGWVEELNAPIHHHWKINKRFTPLPHSQRSRHRLMNRGGSGGQRLSFFEQGNEKYKTGRSERFGEAKNRSIRMGGLLPSTPPVAVGSEQDAIVQDRIGKSKGVRSDRNTLRGIQPSRLRDYFPLKATVLCRIDPQAR